MALPATDDFNRSDLGSLGSNWTPQLGNFAINLNQAVVGAAGSGGHTTEFWNADTFGDDQYSEVVKTAATETRQGVGVRLAGTGASADGYVYGLFGHEIFRIDNGSFTAIMDEAGLDSDAATLRLEAEGTTLRAYKDGVQDGGDTTDATYASGSAGLYAQTSADLDDWEGGNLAAGGGLSIPIAYHHYRQLMANA